MWINPETLEVFYELADGLEQVISTQCPLTDRLEKAVPAAPVAVDGVWYEAWAIEPLTPQEVAQVEEAERVNAGAPADAIAARRYQAETGGITVEGLPIDTGRDSQSLITGAAVSAMLDPGYSVRWKAAGGFVSLDAPQIIALASAVRRHVQACFDREAELVTALAAGVFQPALLEDGWPA